MVQSDQNPRTSMDEGELAGLAQSIRERGLLQSVRVRPIGDGRYQLVAGYRRLMAIDSLGEEYTDTIPAIIAEPETDHHVDAIVENVQRVDLNPIDEAFAYLALLNGGYTPKGIAEQVGVSQARVTKRLELLELPQKAVDSIRTGRTPVSAAKSIKALAKASLLLAQRAVTICGGKDDWNAVLAKAPERVAAHLAKTEPQRFIHVPGDTSLAVAVEQGWLSAEEAKEYRAASSYSNMDDLPNEEVRFRLSTPQGGMAYDGGFRLDERATVYDLKADQDHLKTLALTTLAERKQQEAARRKAAADTRPAKKSAADRTEAEQAEAKAARDAEAQLRKDARGANLDLGSHLKLEVAATRPEGSPLMAVCQAAIESLSLGKIGGGWAFVDVGCQVEEAPKTNGKGEPLPVKVTYPKTQAEREELARKWLAGAETPEEVFGRLYALLVAATLADERAVAQSNRPNSSAWVPREVRDLIPVELHPNAAAREHLDKERAKVAERVAASRALEATDEDEEDEGE